jgi:Prolyl oligopeptidase family
VFSITEVSSLAVQRGSGPQTEDFFDPETPMAPSFYRHQGIELYNIARRAGKNVVLICYGGEDHGLRKKADQIDYERRIFAWFGYYLKGEPAPKWITEGESYLDHQRETANAR